MLKQLLTGITVLALLLGTSLPGFAQSQETVVTAQLKQASKEDISQQELQKFANAFQRVQQFEQEFIEGMFKIVESQGFSRERFGEILQAQQNPEAQPNVEVTPEESEKFDNAIKEIATNQEETIANIQQAIVAEDLELERYTQIFAVVRDDEELQKKVLELIQN